jgi:hypothetical protein
MIDSGVECRIHDLFQSVDYGLYVPGRRDVGGRDQRVIAAPTVDGSA